MSIVRVVNVNKFVKYLLVTDVVIMGMGELLLNVNNVIMAIEIILNDFEFALLKHWVSFFTVGIVPAINKLSDRVDISLVISLHAPNDFIRNKIMLINKKLNIYTAITSVKNYLLKLQISHVMIEYVMLDHINDYVSCAHQLIECLGNFFCKINFIPLNLIFGSKYYCISKIRIDEFMEILFQYQLIVTVHKIRGDDINAACNQLFVGGD